MFTDPEDVPKMSTSGYEHLEHLRAEPGGPTMGHWSFVVPGPPQPKERPCRGSLGHWYTPKRTAQYERAVAGYALAAGIRGPLSGSFSVEIVLWFPDRRRRDIDNCGKAVADALNGIAWQDDSQVERMTVVRAGVDRGNPRAEVRITQVEPVKDAVEQEKNQ